MSGVVLVVVGVALVAEAAAGVRGRVQLVVSNRSAARLPAFARRLPASAVRWLHRADIGPEQWHTSGRRAVVAAVSLASIGIVLGPLEMALLLVLAAAFVAAAAVRLRRRRTTRVIAAVPDMVDAVARAMRAGASLRQALVETASETPGPLGEELSVVVEELERGRPLDAAVAKLVDRVAEPELRVTAATLRLAADNEAGTAQALDGVSTSLRDRVALTAEIRALTSQARASTFVTAALPLAFVGFAAVVDRDSAAYLVRDPFGRLCLITGLLLDAIGFAWMQRLVEGAS